MCYDVCNYMGGCEKSPPLWVVGRRRDDWKLSCVLCDMAAITFDPNVRVSLGERSLWKGWEVAVCKCGMREIRIKSKIYKTLVLKNQDSDVQLSDVRKLLEILS